MAYTHESVPTNPEFSTPQQADILQKAINYLVGGRGTVGLLYMADVLELPSELESEFPDAKDTESGTAESPSYGITAKGGFVSEQDGKNQIGTAQATVELRRWQWVNLDSANHPDGNMSAVHAIYRVLGGVAAGSQEPDYTLEKFLVTNNSSLPIITGPYVTSELAEAVPYAEADALIDYVAGLATDGSFDDAAVSIK